MQPPTIVVGTETAALITDSPPRIANGKTNRYGETLDDAHARIHRDVPSTVDAHSWLTASDKRLPDSGLWRLIGDLGLVGTTTVRRGHRTPPTPDQIRDTYEKVFHEGLGVGLGPRMEREHTNRPFAEAFPVMVGARTALQMSRRTGIGLTRMKRLMGQARDGKGGPVTGDEMAAIAGTFGKKPWYFREVRSAMIAAIVLAKMDDDPDTSARIVRAIAS